ncbi:MAG TPA: extracellular solute-binding protein [Pseudomonadaceae bacterium]|nr:extracellular solute-binding protein [Pseudomonadaceae bacterium]
MKRRILLSAGLLTLLAACSDQGSQSDAPRATDTAAGAANLNPVVVYSSRQEHLIKPVFDRFTAETGIEVQYQTGEEGPLIARLEAEGTATFADILYTVDAGNLWAAADKGLLAPLESPVLEANIPAHLQDPNNQWFGFSVRARTIVYSTERVDPAELSSYEALADPAWQGRLCLRTSKKVYNMSLVGALMERLGAQRTEEVVSGWVNNLATPVFSSDTLLINAIAAGQCDVGLVNTYYLGRELVTNPDLPVGLFWANQGDSGVHVNVSGAGLTRHAKNPEGARILLEWLSTEEPQRMFSELNLEFPANPAIPSVKTVQAWGEFQQDSLNVEAAGRNQAAAVMLMDRVGYR